MSIYHLYGVKKSRFPWQSLRDVGLTENEGNKLLCGMYGVGDVDEVSSPLLSVILSLIPVCVSLLLVGLFPPC